MEAEKAAVLGSVIDPESGAGLQSINDAGMSPVINHTDFTEHQPG